MSPEPGACRELGTYLTGSEAKELADRIGAGGTLTSALAVVASARRSHARDLLTRAGLGPEAREFSCAVLGGIAGAHERRTAITPVWTAPGSLAGAGALTASIHHYVDRARESVICSTFNVQRSSALWTALRDAAARTEVSVRIYLDTAAADEEPAAWKPTTAEVAEVMASATVLRTRQAGAVLVRNHAKFLAVDHQFLIVTSANFSRSAEQLNVELGLVIENPRLTQQVEQQMRSFERSLYEAVPARTAVPSADAIPLTGEERRGRDQSSAASGGSS